MAKYRTQGEGSIRKRDDGRWEGRIVLPNGKRKSLYAKSMKELKLKMAEAYERAEEESRNAQQSLTVGEWADTWFRDYLNVKKSTAARYDVDIRLHIKPGLGCIRLIDLTTRDLQRFYKTKEQEGLSLKSIKNMHGVIHAMLNQAAEEGLVPTNVSLACKLKPPPKQKMHPIKDDDIKRFLTAIRGSKYEQYFYIVLFTGLRRAEAIGLTWDCIDFAGGTITVYRQWAKIQKPEGGITREFHSLKNNKVRTIRPASQVISLLKNIRRQQAVRRLACGEGWHDEYDFVFTTTNGLPYNGDQVFHEFKIIVQSIGLGDTRIHDLRHTYATLSLQNGTDIKTVSESLGHATTAFTMDQYGDVSETMKRNSAERMEKFINSL